jgi:hypothetical protein
MATPALIPFETCNVPLEIQLELKRRKKNRSFNHKDSQGWDSSGGNWEEARGPMSAWVRVCSNGMGRSEIKKPGFILTGGKSFYQTYGFSWNGEGNQQVLGYTPHGKPHTLSNELTNQYPIHVPSPEITKVETVIQKELFRRCWIHWTCFSTAQLEYMTPYFLVPGITCIVEFGWNHFNQKSLIDLTDEAKLAEYYFSNPYPLYRDNILNSNGNYDCVFGLITDYAFSIEGNKFHCMTEITSKDRLYAGVPISTIVAEKKNVDDPKTEVDYFSNIKQICEGDFIKNLKSIATSKTLDDIPQTKSNSQLLQLIKGGRITGESEMKKEYWRGIFYGRDNDNIIRSSGLDYKWTTSIVGDFDKNLSDDNVWVNMGFLVELMNRCLPLPSIRKDVGFFGVNVDESVIGAHPNHISCDGSILLIPNAFAPKYMWGDEGIKQNGTGGDYNIQFRPNSRKINTQQKDKNDLLWNANYQLLSVFKQGRNVNRDDIDWVINANRYTFPTERSVFCFPFVSEEVLKIKNREKEAKYDAYFYGYFKDLYFNVKRFIELVKDDNIKTYFQLYRAVFDDINKAGGNFWDLTLVPNDNTGQLTVTDNRMLPSGNNKSEPFYFDYLDSDSLLNGLGFKPKMSEAQSFRILFAETNNPKSKTVVKGVNDLLDYKFDDRLLVKNQSNSPTIIHNNDSSVDPFLEKVKTLQHFEPINGSYQFTIMVGDQPFFRRLSLPDAEMLNCLLDDQDFDRNQRYTGIQPITVEVPLQGIGGLRTFMTFLIRNLPNPYHHKDVAYRIVDVHHVIENGIWNTSIKAGIIPLRGYVKQKLGITE